MRTLAAVLTVVALLALGTAVYFRGLARATGQKTAALQANDLRPQFAAVEGRLAEAEQRVKTADDESGRLLKELAELRAAEKARAAASARPVITRETVEARYRLGLDLVRQGDHEAALRELLWCYDEGMVRIASFVGVRSSSLVLAIGKLGENHPPARAALAERRDRVEAQMLGAMGDGTLALELVSMNKALGQTDRSLALLDKLPADDRRRESLTLGLYDELLAVRRYEEAASGRPYSRMISSLDTTMAQARALPEGIRDPERMRQALKTGAVRQALRDVEVLAGAGRPANARVLAEKLLELDDSTETRSAIQDHAARAGRPDLMTTASP